MRYGTTVDGGRVYVQTPEGRLVVGDLQRIVDLAGGPAWTIEYSDWHRERYPDLDTSDEGLTVDVVDVIEAMTHDEAFVETLRAQPATAAAGDVPPRTGLFVGKLMDSLQSGVE